MVISSTVNYKTSRNAAIAILHKYSRKEAILNGKYRLEFRDVNSNLLSTTSQQIMKNYVRGIDDEKYFQIFEDIEDGKVVKLSYLGVFIQFN